MIKAIIFDFDDTLYPERDYVMSGFRAVARTLVNDSYGYSGIFNELARLFDEQPKQVFDRYANKNRLPRSVVEDCLRIYRWHEPDIELSEQAKFILSWLKNKGMLLGLLTDGRPEGQRAKIKALNLEYYMDTIVVTDELGGIEFRKPNPAGYETILQNLRMTPQESMYVGDNLRKDFLFPNLSGMVSVLYIGANGLYFNGNAPQGGSPQYIIDNLLCLRNILEMIELNCIESKTNLTPNNPKEQFNNK